MKIVYAAMVFSASSLAVATPLPMPYDVFAHQSDDDHIGTATFLHHLVAAERVADRQLHPAHSLAYSSIPGHLSSSSSYYSSSNVHPYTGVRLAAAAHVNTTAPQHGSMMVKNYGDHAGNVTQQAHIIHPAGATEVGHEANITESHVAAHSAAHTGAALPEAPHNGTHGGPLASSVHGPAGNATTAGHADKDEAGGDEKASEAANSTSLVAATTDKKPDASEEHKNAAPLTYGGGIVPLLTLVATAAGAMALL